MLLAKYTKLFINIDDAQYDFGQFNLLKVIYKNNKQLCENFPDSLYQHIMHIIKEHGRQKRFI